MIDYCKYGLALLSAVMATAVLSTSVNALPIGRAWTDVDTLLFNGSFLLGPRLEVLQSGRLRLIASGITSPRSIQIHEWSRDRWEPARSLDYGSGFLWPFLSDADEEHLVWKGIVAVEPPGTHSYLLYLQTVPDVGTAADTVALSEGGSIEYAGAASGLARWIVTDDAGNLRMFRALRPDGAWTEVKISGDGSAGVTIAALDDTTALAVWAGNGSFQSAAVRGDSIKTIPLPMLLPKGGPGRPKLRRHPQGGYWLAWDQGLPYVNMTRFLVGAWSAPESIQCRYVDSDQYIGQSPDLSHDDRLRPVVAWSSYSTRTSRNAICVACPTDSGYAFAEELPQSNDGFLPSPARDENGDVWIAWWKYVEGAFWIHSYTAVEIQDAAVDGSPFDRRIAWSLTGPAPGSWWSILRAEAADTNYTLVGRVQAGSSTAVEWSDSTTADLTYRYRIRRDCKDVRYELLSEPIESRPDALTWLPLSLSSTSGNPVRGTTSLRVDGAAPGQVTVRIFDVLGRRVGTAVMMAGSSGTVLLASSSWDSPQAGALRAGLYFARANDARGRTSRTLKLVVLGPGR